MPDRNNLIDAAKNMRDAMNSTIMTILALEKEGDIFKETILELKLQAGDMACAIQQIETELGL